MVSLFFTLIRWTHWVSVLLCMTTVIHLTDWNLKPHYETKTSATGNGLNIWKWAPRNAVRRGQTTSSALARLSWFIRSKERQRCNVWGAHFSLLPNRSRFGFLMSFDSSLPVGGEFSAPKIRISCRENVMSQECVCWSSYRSLIFWKYPAGCIFKRPTIRDGVLLCFRA